MARRIGQGQPKALNAVFQSAMLVICCFAIVFFFMIQTSVGDMLMGYSKDKALAQEQIVFLSVRSYGFFMGILMLSLNSCFMATGKTWVIMVSTAIFAFSNIILDYLLIFGFWNVRSEERRVGKECRCWWLWVYYREIMYAVERVSN